MRERVVIVGSSVAGIRTGQALRGGGFDGDIVVIGAEEVDPYDKPPLSKEFLTGQKSVAQFALLDGGGWAGSGLKPLLGNRATALDCDAKLVTLDSGQRVGYDRLVIATGARPRRLIDTAGNPVGHTIRGLDDSQALKSAMQRGGRIVVIGGGFIGCEVASTARQLGCEATIVNSGSLPLAAVVGTEVGALLGELHSESGTTVVTGVKVDTVHRLGDDGARVVLSNGRVLDADILVAGIGVTPNTEWLSGSAVVVEDGVRTDEFCRALGTDDVYAVGDVANWHDVIAGRPRRVGHWTNAVDQAELVAHNIIRAEQPREYQAAPYFWSDQYGHKIQMIGQITPTDTVEMRHVEGSGRPCWAAVFSRQQRLVAAATFGWPRAMAVLRRLWLQHADAEDAMAELDALAEKTRGPVVAATK
jgi:NADPH-dependent 2,4-dienoyl-CoA reductase/sulfur reductase-like enzyme